MQGSRAVNGAEDVTVGCLRDTPSLNPPETGYVYSADFDALRGLSPAGFARHYPPCGRVPSEEPARVSPPRAVEIDGTFRPGTGRAQQPRRPASTWDTHQGKTRLGEYRWLDCGSPRLLEEGYSANRHPTYAPLPSRAVPSRDSTTIGVPPGGSPALFQHRASAGDSRRTGGGNEPLWPWTAPTGAGRAFPTHSRGGELGSVLVEERCAPDSGPPVRSVRPHRTALAQGGSPPLPGGRRRGRRRRRRGAVGVFR